MLTNKIEELANISPRVGMALARFYIMIFQLSRRVTIFVGPYLATAGKGLGIMLICLFKGLSEILNNTMLMTVSSALFAIASGVLWFISAILQQILDNVETTEKLASVSAQTMQWQTYAGFTATIAAILALFAAASSRK